MTPARTAATLCEISLLTVQSWVCSNNIGNASEAGLDGKYAKYEVNEVAAWLFTNHQAKELSSYPSGHLDVSRMDYLRSAIGIGFTEPDGMNTRQPLLIEHDRLFVAAELRRKLLREAETRGVKPIVVLLDAFAELRRTA